MKSTSRWHAIIAFDGNDFHGWQKQPRLPTVQATIEACLSQVANQTIITYAAGRTDKGVHAEGLSLHFDTTAERSAAVWIRAVNSLLPKSIRCLAIKPVAQDFHARHSAISRSYCYKICLDQTALPVFLRHNHLWFPYSLDLKALNTAWDSFIGEHDFSGYRGRDCQALSPIKTILSTNIKHVANAIQLEITGSAFLHHMVRNMVGACLLVGQGKRNLSWLQQTLIAKTRVPDIPMAPAQGLTFIKANYPNFSQ